ncbi:uncharacterized protein PgNI_09405 [Pyricularia grisea]|uniref:Uncharacterized protein n=1 Tax=Pyricularia grisea TaxID=148305 RepID=A0A6P8ARF1_PYRGI|nr:uncharacterized protein PgNI_09405 [Pyricularia grisea]TLD04693.1 hypothetical protein PgNI_09405 [Pyricularia grisea]
MPWDHLRRHKKPRKRTAEQAPRSPLVTLILILSALT